MDILGNVLGVASSAVGGGLLGIAGSLIGRVFTYLEKKQDQKFKLQQWEQEYKLQQLQIEARKQETEQEIALSTEQGRWAGLTASINADANGRSSYPWVAAVKDLMRPVITTLLIGLTAYVVIAIAERDIRIEVIYSIVFLTNTCVAWWFGDRAPQMKAQIQRGR